MAPSTAINTRTLAAPTILVRKVFTIPHVERQVQIVKGLVQQERSVLLEQPPAQIVLQGSLARQLERPLALTALPGNSARQPELRANPPALSAGPVSTLELPLPPVLPARLVHSVHLLEPQAKLRVKTAPPESTARPLEPQAMLHV